MLHTIHSTVILDEGVSIGAGTYIWHYSHIGANVGIGENCVIGERVLIGSGSQIANRCKIQTGALLYSVILRDGVFIGPGAICCNDRYPRAINIDGSLKKRGDWQKRFVTIGEGASLGAGCIVLDGLQVGKWALIAAGAVVLSDVPDFAVVVGNPGRIIGYTDESGLGVIE